MLLSLFDPDLLFFTLQDLRTRPPHCVARIAALTLHHNVISHYGLPAALSDTLVALVWQTFPWAADRSTIPDLHDLRTLISDVLSRARTLRADAPTCAQVRPAGVVCRCVTDNVAAAWEMSLPACLRAAQRTQCYPVIASWQLTCTSPMATLEVVLALDGTQPACTQGVALVWDEHSWAVQLWPLAVTQWWPDLDRCVALYYSANPGVGQHVAVRTRPLRLVASPRFQKSLQQHCTERWLREKLVRALTKKVYGIHDPGLNDERFGDMRRFYVTDFWRVNYRQSNDALLLEEFGPHDVGLG